MKMLMNGIKMQLFQLDIQRQVAMADLIRDTHEFNSVNLIRGAHRFNLMNLIRDTHGFNLINMILDSPCLHEGEQSACRLGE